MWMPSLTNIVCFAIGARIGASIASYFFERRKREGFAELESMIQALAGLYYATFSGNAHVAGTQVHFKIRYFDVSNNPVQPESAGTKYVTIAVGDKTLAKGALAKTL